jgi:EAL domain-containing protein (putative c-di-GMP-specific phosphodiesterase class I)
MEQWKLLGLSIPISINVNALQLQHPEFSARLQTLIKNNDHITSGDLELEVLETSALEDFQSISKVMQTCQLMGINFAVDDFGTGYSSLTYLKQLPAEVLKIDQSFVRDMLDDPDDLAILKAILGLASTFNRKAIAEGVETIEHGERLLEIGCVLGQGYAIARPMPHDELIDWVNEWKQPETWKRFNQ